MFYVAVIISCFCTRQAKASTKEEMDREMQPRLTQNMGMDKDVHCVRSRKTSQQAERGLFLLSTLSAL